MAVTISHTQINSFRMLARRVMSKFLLTSPLRSSSLLCINIFFLTALLFLCSLLVGLRARLKISSLGAFQCCCTLHWLFSCVIVGSLSAKRLQVAAAGCSASEAAASTCSLCSPRLTFQAGGGPAAPGPDAQPDPPESHPGREPEPAGAVIPLNAGMIQGE